MTAMTIGPSGRLPLPDGPMDRILLTNSVGQVLPLKAVNLLDWFLFPPVRSRGFSFVRHTVLVASLPGSATLQVLFCCLPIQKNVQLFPLHFHMPSKDYILVVVICALFGAL